MREKKALEFRRAVQRTAQNATNTQALTMQSLYDSWEAGVSYGGENEPQIVRWADGLYRIRQHHTSQAGWEPDKTPAMWQRIDLSHAGTREDPIPYSGNMALSQGLYYSQDGVTYRCTRDTGDPVFAALRDLLGLYVEVAE